MNRMDRTFSPLRMNGNCHLGLRPRLAWVRALGPRIERTIEPKTKDTSQTQANDAGISSAHGMSQTQASIPYDSSANGVRHTSPGKRPGVGPNAKWKGLKARPISSGLALLAGCMLGLPLQAATFSVTQEDGAVRIDLDGELFTRYVYQGEGNKPYFHPLNGPDGLQLTRSYPMENVEGEKRDHPHHRGMFFGHQDISGVNTWHEKESFVRKAVLPKLGSNETVDILQAEAFDDHAVLETTSVYRDHERAPALRDVRRFVFRVDEQTDARIVDVDIRFTATEGPITIGDIKDAGFSIRVAHSMTVDAGKGGSIVNSEGHRNKAAWGKRAAWCDFHGPVNGKTMGIAILNHPSSLHFPTPWHVRTYGLFTANAFGFKSVARESRSGAVDLEKGESCSLKYRVILHRGTAEDANIPQAFEQYRSMSHGDRSP